MDIRQFQDELFQTLEAQFRELSFDTESVPGAQDSPQIGNTLLFLMPITVDDDRALTDLRFVKIDDERYYVQIFSTIFTDLKSGYDELEKAVSMLNYQTRIGAYGMYPPKRQFWYKYGYAVRDYDLIDGAHGFAAALLDVLDLIREQHTVIYDLIAALASGEITHQKAVQSGMLDSF